jgi:hypothetical protein
MKAESAQRIGRSILAADDFQLQALMLTALRGLALTLAPLSTNERQRNRFVEAVSTGIGGSDDGGVVYDAANTMGLVDASKDVTAVSCISVHHFFVVCLCCAPFHNAAI